MWFIDEFTISYSKVIGKFLELTDHERPWWMTKKEKKRERCQQILYSNGILSCYDNRAKCFWHEKVSIYETQKMFEMDICLKKDVGINIFSTHPDIYPLLMGKFMLGSLLH